MKWKFIIVLCFFVCESGNRLNAIIINDECLGGDYDILLIDPHNVYDVVVAIDTTTSYADLFPQLRTFEGWKHFYNQYKDEQKYRISCKFNILYVWWDEYMATFMVTKHDTITDYELGKLKVDTLSCRVKFLYSEAQRESDGFHSKDDKRYYFLCVKSGTGAIRYTLHRFSLFKRKELSYKGHGLIEYFGPIKNRMVCDLSYMDYPIGGNFNLRRDEICRVIGLRMFSDMLIRENMLVNVFTWWMEPMPIYEETKFTRIPHEAYPKRYVLLSSYDSPGYFENKLIHLGQYDVILTRSNLISSEYIIYNTYVAKSVYYDMCSDRKENITLRYMYIPYVMFMPLGIFDFEIESINGISYEKFMMNYNDMVKSR